VISPDEMALASGGTPDDLYAPSKHYRAGDNAHAWIKEIGRNTVTPAYVLRRLALSTDSEVRMAVADHLNTPKEVLLLLACDDNPDVRYAIAENHNINREVLNMLSSDANPYVGRRAEQTLSRLKATEVSRISTLSRASA